MHMETLSCGYPVAPTDLGTSSMSSSPTTLTSASKYTHNCGAQLYADTPYAESDYTTTQLHDSYSIKYNDEDSNNNNRLYENDSNNNNNYDYSVVDDLSNLSICESEDRYSDLSPLSESPDVLSESSSRASSVSSSRIKSRKSSRSKAKLSNQSTTSQSSTEDEDKNRKDSFVYDVRLPDEQFLFFVPDLDLVKSHLMFAVREEVDVLKDRIVELMDRIKHLECENSILRQYASQDVLQQLQSQMPHQLQQPSHHTSTS